MRKRPEIPEDVFFNVTPAVEEPPEELVEPAEEVTVQVEPADDVLEKSMGEKRPTPRSYQRLSDTRKAPEPRSEPDSEPARVGRPPAQEGPKVAVTLYLTEPVAHMLEEVKFLLLTEYDVRTSKSAIADFAMRNGLRDLQAAADDLRRE